MNEIIVKIKWDGEDDPHWLNQYNIKLALEMCCTNTKFEVEEIAQNNLQTLTELKNSIMDGIRKELQKRLDNR